MIRLDPQTPSAPVRPWPFGVVAVAVEPRPVLVRSPTPSFWRPTLGTLVAEHRMGGVVLEQDVLTLSLDLLRVTPDWVTEDIDFGKITALRGWFRKTPA